MAKTTITIDAPRDAVFSVLADGYSYADWVVGSKRIRSVDANWPAPGASFHHTIGVGPLALNDSSSVIERDSKRRLVLRVRFRPAGMAHVVFTLESKGKRSTVVTMEEFPVSAVLKRIWNPGLDAATHVRNLETLRRLKRVVERRAQQETATA